MYNILLLIILMFFASCSQQNKHKQDSQRNEDGKECLQIGKGIPPLAYSYKIEGNREADLGYYNKALVLYTKALEQYPDYDTVYYNIAVTYAEMGDIANAMNSYNKTIRINPQYANAYFNRALLKTGAEAIKDYTKAIESNPNYAKAYYNRGWIYSDMGKEDEALKDYLKALEVSPKPLEASTADMLSNIGLIYYEREEFGLALSYYNQAIEVAPNEGDLYYNRGLTKKRLNDRDGACEDWKKAKSLGISAANVVLATCGE